VGTFLARLPWKKLWMSCRSRAQPLRLLQLRIKQNLLFDLQGILSVSARLREINEKVARLRCWSRNSMAASAAVTASITQMRVTIIELINHIEI